jgi:uncharacterized membrane protein
MKKLILIFISLLVFSLFVLAQETTTPTSTQQSTTTPSTTTPPAATSTPHKGKEVDLACMKNAVEKREDALKTARETYFNKVMQAYEARKSALLDAWTIQNHKERQKKIHEAWKNFRESVRSAWLEYKKEHNQIWKTFVQERKNCKANSTGENPGIDLNF